MTLDFLDAELENDIKVEVCAGKQSIRQMIRNRLLLMLMFGVLIFSFFPTSNFLSHTHWTDKEKNDRRRNGKLHNIHAGEIPRWGNLDFYFILFSPCWKIFGPFCDRVCGKFSTLCWPECRPLSATLTRARGPTATRQWRGRTTGKISPAHWRVHLFTGWKMPKARESLHVRLDGSIEATTKTCLFRCL